MSVSFSTPVRLDQIRSGERLDLKANEDERKAIANRLALGGVDRLEAHVVLDREGEIVKATGRLQARLSQRCVVTGEPINTSADEPFALVFMPESSDSDPESEIELGEEDCDTVFYDGATIALGDAIADTLALSLDPYPRSAGADAALKEAGVLSEGEAGPFAALAALKGKFDQAE